MDIQTEAELIGLCKKDLNHFTRIYKHYLDDVYRYCYSILENTTEAEEITSEVFLSAVENIHKYQFMGKTIKCWFFTIARNIIYKSYRKPETYTLHENWQGVTDEKVLDQIADRETLQKIEELIKLFNPPIPEIIRLKVWEEMNFEEIAEVVGKSLSAVKMSYYRSMDKIKSQFEMEGIKVL